MRETLFSHPSPGCTGPGAPDGGAPDAAVAREASAPAEPASPPVPTEIDLLREAIDGLPEGVAIFDPDDRYLFWNRKYAEFYAATGVLPQKGQRFESYLRAMLDARQVPGALGREAAWLADRMARHAKPYSRHEHEIAGARWIRVEERRLAGGGTIGIRVDITEHKRREFALAHLAHHDPLTGLANRLVLRERLEAAVAVAAADDPAALVLLDLDRFKAVNDTLGHAAGDDLLRQVAGRLVPEVARDGTAVRLGGDEFAVVARHAGDGRSVEALAARIVGRLGEPYEVMGHRVAIGASAGIALIPLHGADADTLFRHADAALYRAKTAGRGLVRSFSAPVAASGA